MKFKCLACGKVFTQDTSSQQVYPGQFEDEIYITCPDCGSDEFKAVVSKETVWLILTGDGAALRGRYQGTRKQAVDYCKRHYMPKGYRVVKSVTLEYQSKMLIKRLPLMLRH